MRKRTQYSLSAEEMQQAVTVWLAAHSGIKATEVAFISKKGFFPQTSYDIEITEET